MKARSPSYSQEAADQTVEFFGCLKLTKGRWHGVPFRLAKWQEDRIVRPLFGTVIPNPNRASRRAFIRRYRRAFVGIGSKNGKTGIASGIAAKGLYADGEFGAEVYSAASSRDQATLVYRELASMVRQTPELRKISKLYDSIKRIYVPSTESFFQALSSDADTSDGVNPSMWIVDELHRHKNRELYDMLRQKTGTREQPLGIVITTAGYDRSSVCYSEWQYARRVQAGLVDDPTYLAVIYEIPEESATFEQIAADEALWPLANPALGEFLDIEDLRMVVREAKEKPSDQPGVLRLRFNVWTQAESRWFTREAWDGCGGLVDETKLAGQDAYGGLDLASTSDFASWLMVIPQDGGGYAILPRFFLPQAAVDKRKDMRAQLTAWARQGFMEITPGDVLDYDRVKARIRADAERFRIREIGYDPWNAAQIAVQLQDEGLTMVPVRQGFGTLSSPAKLLENLVSNGRLNHGGHPLLRWMADNVVIETNADGAIKPSKKHSTEKIDGIAALVTALERAMHATETSVAMCY
jgi:phage terminase large subunit-like protein